MSNKKIYARFLWFERQVKKGKFLNNTFLAKKTSVIERHAESPATIERTMRF